MLINQSVEAFFKEHPLPQVKEAYYSEDTVFFLYSNERAQYNFYDELKKRYRFDGYIYGCGSTTIWTLLEAFPPGVVPKGMILADIEPRVICYTKLFIHLLKKHAEFDGLIDELAAIVQKHWESTLRSIVEQETEIALKQALMQWLGSDHAKVPPGGKLLWRRSLLRHDADRANWYDPKKARISVLTLIKKNYPTLHTLAKNGNLVIMYRDVFDSMLNNAVANLPDFRHSTSLVYLSNALDHVLMKSDFRRNYPSLCRFIDYVNGPLLSGLHRMAPEPSHQIVTIDTLRTQNYFLRFQEGIPTFAFYHFLGGT